MGMVFDGLSGSGRRAFILAVVLLSVAGYLATRGANIVPIACTSNGRHNNPGTARTYSTTFSLTEGRVSEGGNWINGKAVGIDWSDIRTTVGLAFGAESGNNGYDDSTALLTGTWGPDQSAEATVHSVNQNDNVFEEVELRLRSSLSAHSATGYEINFRCSKTANAYAQIVRWNGPLGSFNYVATAQGSKYGVTNGDVVKAAIVGSTITVYINGVQVLQATDKRFTSGSPGMGFFLQGATGINSGINSDYGFSRFSAAD
jgi:hypothetical protein